MQGVGFVAVIPDLDSEKAKVKLRANVEKVMKKAAEQWLIAVSAKIPVRTGFLAGSFTKLENTIGGSGLISRFRRAIFGTAIGKKTRRASIKGEYYYYPGGRVLKTPTSGIPFTIPESDIFSGTEGLVTFRYWVNIIYMDINDNFPIIASAPWYSFRAGAIAFNTYVQKELPKVLAIENYTTIQTIRGGNAV